MAGASEGWSGKRDSNPRLRPWQGRTLPLSYSRSLRKSSVTQRYLRDQEKADLKVRLYICLVGAVLRVRGRRGLRTRVAKNLRRLFGRSRIQIEPGRPLESGDLRQLRNDFHMPVIELGRWFDDWRGVNQQVVRRRTEGPVDAAEDVAEQPRQR